MKNILSLRFIALPVLVLSLFVSCKKEDGPLSDSKPAVPVIVSNAIAFRPEPTVSFSKAAVVNGVTAPIQIVLTIPSSSGRTIKEITKVAASTSYTAIQSTGTTGFYTTGPIAASGTSVTFNTTAAEYTAKTGQAITATNTELGRRFYFMLTLDDGSVIITEAVRVLVQD
ncbi:MAG: hypothetical protein ABIT96_13960 [Ferruginibacter sp.]